MSTVPKITDPADVGLWSFSVIANSRSFCLYCDQCGLSWKYSGEGMFAMTFAKVIVHAEGHLDALAEEAGQRMTRGQPFVS